MSIKIEEKPAGVGNRPFIPPWAPESYPNKPLVWWNAMPSEIKEAGAMRIFCELEELRYRRIRFPSLLKRLCLSYIF